MDLGVAGRVAFVSGGSNGIGRVPSKWLGGEGVRVIVTARSKEAVDETVDAIRARGGDATSFANAIPAGWEGQPEGMAAVVAFLRSVGAGYPTGELINVDGGVHRSAF